MTNFNQHLKDVQLVHSVEISEEGEISQLQSSHMDLRDMKDDLKSIKSYKSKGSIKSEVQPEQLAVS